MITTDFNSAEQNKGNVLKDKENNYQFESLKDKGKFNFNNNCGDTDSIDNNCSSCRTDTKTNMSTNNIIKVRIKVIRMFVLHLLFIIKYSKPCTLC